MTATRFIGVLSGKGGVGKTTVSLNVATALAQYGKEAVLVEANFTTPSLGVFFGAHALSSTINAVLNGEKHICDVAYMHRSGVKVIPASLRLDEYNPNRLVFLKQALLELEGNVEIAVIDGASGIGAEADATVRCLDALIVVTTPDLVSVADALRTITHAESLGCTVLGVIVNQVRNDGFELSEQNIFSFLRKSILGVIPFDAAVREAAWIKHPVVFSHPNSQAAVVLCKIAQQLIQ